VSVLLFTVYLVLNALVLGFKVSSILSASLRAANLTLVNMVFLYATPHLGFLTNTLGLEWSSVCRLHHVVGIMTIILLTFHVVVAAKSSKFSVDTVEETCTVIVG
jgi:predicted ferric reductase